MKKIKEFSLENAADLILLLCELVIGILLLIHPVRFTIGIIIILGCIIALLGILCIVRYFRTDPASAAVRQYLALGLSLISCGALFVGRASWFVMTFPLLTMLYGIAILLTGFEKIQWTVDLLRIKSPKWWLTAISAAFAVTFSIVILANPFATAVALWIFIGIALVAEALLDIAGLVLRNISFVPKHRSEKASAADALSDDTDHDQPYMS